MQQALKRFNVALPVLPEKTQALKEFVKTITQSRWEEYSAFQERYHVQKVTWTLQHTQRGDLFVVYNETEKDLGEIVEQIITSTHPFDVWFKEKVIEITGIDPNALKGPLAEQLLEYGY